MKTLNIKLEIPDEAYDLLLKIKQEGYAEYRDTLYDTLEEFRRDASNHNRTDEWFLNRNCGGTFYLIDELLKYDLIDTDDDAWHLTFKLSMMGEMLLEQNNIAH